MYLLQIDGGQITLSCPVVNPKSIHETFKESLLRIFMTHIQPDPIRGGWKFLTSEGESMEDLLHKCKISLSYHMGPDAFRLKDPSSVMVCLLRSCSYYLPETWHLRHKWGV